MYALRKLLLIIALLFSSSIALFFDACLLCSILRLTLFILILLPVSYDRMALILETFGLILAFVLSWLDNPLFCEGGCSVLLSLIPLFSLLVFFILFTFRAIALRPQKKPEEQ
ncbi:MAG: hypothetical protein ACOYK9_01035 [Chlamydiia bacterium]